jgi:hypothetical protein
MEVLNKLDKKLETLPLSMGNQCGTHMQLMTILKEKVDNHEKQLEELNKYKWKIAGAVTIITFIISTFSKYLFK